MPVTTPDDHVSTEEEELVIFSLIFSYLAGFSPIRLLAAAAAVNHGRKTAFTEHDYNILKSVVPPSFSRMQVLTAEEFLATLDEQLTKFVKLSEDGEDFELTCPVSPDHKLHRRICENLGLQMPRTTRAQVVG